MQAEIEKLANDYLGFVHFPPLLKVRHSFFIPEKGRLFVCLFCPTFDPFSSHKDELEKEVEQRKIVNLELVFGYHWKPGTGKSVSL